jgi:uncharacterized protein (TIGR03083 family)
MSRSRKRQLLLDERRDLHGFLSGLGAADWETPSLCADWTVLEVAAHLSSFLGVTRRGLITRGMRFGTGTHGANARSAAAWATMGIPEIVAGLESPERLGLGFFYPGWALSEAVVHHQDMRRALRRPRVIPEERLRVALSFLLRLPTGTGARRYRRHVAFRATDIDWSHGTGPEVRGPAEAILMAIAGRRSALDELSGEGRKVLAG